MKEIIVGQIAGNKHLKETEYQVNENHWFSAQ